MQIKLICTGKVSHLAPFLKREFLKLENGLFTMLRNLHSDCPSVGPLCHTRVLNTHIRIRQNTHANRTIGKRIRFVKETFRFVQFVRIIVSPSVDLYDHSWSTACCMSLAAQVASRNAQWREVRLHLITGTPNDSMFQNNCYKEQIDTTWKSLKLQKD